ncbi:protein pleiotropic regulatory locus 1-like, partial [Trifolium medium]|nr:protein pleiotropic regulatory locus 1-like [Trifolium medium]
SQQKTIINAMAVNEEGVMVTGGDNGSMWFWDWKSGHNFQQSQTIVQPGMHIRLLLLLQIDAS